MIGYYNGEPNINLEEVEHWQWMSIDNIKNDMQQNPQNYTVWFKIIFEQFSQHFN
jgi:isopentenyl-diphosphate delta-isomerase